jgi:superfamily II DNA or RNA helicase
MLPISPEDQPVFELFALRPYQIAAIFEIRELIRQGKKNICVCAPTGAGKTRIAACIIYLAKKKGSRSAFVVDRVNLVDQTSVTFDEYKIDHGVMQASHWRFRPYERAQICSAQTLARRRWPDADMIVVDECHTVSKVTTERIEPRETTALGLTATPFSKGLGKLYDALVNVATTNALIEQGHLSKYRIFAASEPNMEGVRVVGGEWDEKEASKRAMAVVGDCVSEYLKHGSGKKFICSAVDCAHVEELQRQFMAAGVMCATYTYKVGDDERADIVKEFRKPDSYIRGLITVTAATKGFDVPDIGVVIMARPLRRSIAEHIQFFGRGLRTHPGKDVCIVLDHSGNSERFWDEWTAFFETGALELDDGRKAKPKKKASDIEDRMRKCPHCKHLHMPMPFCPACGHEYPKREAVKHVAGTLAELVASGDRRALTAELWPQVVGYARAKRTGDGARKLALALYRKMTGQWPGAEFESTQDAPLSREVANRIRSLNIAYAKSKRPAGSRDASFGAEPGA